MIGELNVMVAIFFPSTVPWIGDGTPPPPALLID
jgi:hypothetical protein